jgi:hypothetical protein
MEHVGLGHASIAELPRVRIIGYLQNATADIRRMTGEEDFDIIAINTQSTVETEDTADRGDPPKTAKADSSGWRPPG